MKRKWNDKKILILGFSRSGVSAAKYLNSKGAECYISDAKEYTDKDNNKLKELNDLGIQVEFKGHSAEFIDDAYIAITSPGIPPRAEIFSILKDKKIPVISEIELAYLESEAPIVAITGTNGKTTTTSLISHILESEFSAPACGNIGLPPTSLLDQKHDYLVCEVSSYQLEMSPTFRPQIACFLNFTPDHIDWHQGLDNYYKAKEKLFAEYKKPAFAVFNASDETVYTFSKNYSGEKFLFAKEFDNNSCYIKNDSIFFKRIKEEEIINLNEVPLVGEHNYQNIMSAIIVAKIVGISTEKIKERIISFKAVEHRIEFVSNISGKDFYNDSKATNPEAAIVAINSFPAKSVTLIAGGRDKNTDLSEFCAAVKSRIKTVILIGEATERFENTLKNSGFDNIILANTMESALDISFKIDNQVVLLSPACASFDMFESYEQRGEVFKEYVLSRI